MKVLIIVVDIIFLLLAVKLFWMAWAMHGYGNPEKEKKDILQRRDWLIEKVCVNPDDLFHGMPRSIGAQFQGEWSLYSCSMLAQALANIAMIYPETKAEALTKIDSLISIVMSPKLREYDERRWHEDPLDSLEGEKSHISYISHLAWMMGNYKKIGGDSRHDALYERLCEAMSRRMSQSPNLNLPTYPGEPVYIPDMLVAVVALHQNGKYDALVEEWMERAKTEWIDAETGLLKSFLDVVHDVKGSYTSLNCYYLTFVDADFARNQYALLKKYFYRDGILSGIREHSSRSPLVEPDIDAGIILFGLSPSATAFAVGPATFFNDNHTRNSLLRTAEIAGHTVGKNGRRHYMLADIAVVGEAITLAMRTHRPEAMK